ncbi:IS5 family transposase [Streptomyces sp. NBC_00328]|uniref:IS5 family transposase n=1 Tax=Streptomyces sp. NBC_00328 TaxID=2903646 RepID=UPI002E297AA6|nr:IS5 family transposase [Streptomyces sp. NBC_00328]
MPERRRYPSDLSDARWKLVEPVLTAWRSERRGRGLDIGRPPDHDLRSLLDAVLYVNRTGIPWRYLPHDYPHWNTVYAYFARWQEEGVFDQLNSLLRRQVRRQEGRSEEPSACVIDSQSVKTSANVPASGQGIDAGKKIVGRKRSIVIDTVGLLLGALVTAASVQDSVAGQILIERVAAEHPTVRKTWVDGGYRQHLVEHAATLGIDMETTQRRPGKRGFTPIPKRWAVERTYAWLMLHRRLARDYETLPVRSEAMIHIAMTDLMARRLTGESVISWRDPTPQTKHQIPG